MPRRSQEEHSISKFIQLGGVGVNPEKSHVEFEQSPEQGHNITLHFVFARHGEPSDTAGGPALTEKGQAQAAELGSVIETPHDGIKVYYSDKERAQQTADILMDQVAVPKAQSEKIQALTKKGFEGVRIHRKERLLGTGLLNKELIREQFGGSAQFVEKTEEEIPPDITSPRELASAVARHVMRFVDVSATLPSNVEGTIVNITHLPTLLSFLKNTIGDHINQNPINPDGKSFVEKIGGGMDHAEQVALKIYRKDQEDVQLDVQLRGRSFVINLEDLQTLAAYSRTE